MIKHAYTQIFVFVLNEHIFRHLTRVSGLSTKLKGNSHQHTFFANNDLSSFELR